MKRRKDGRLQKQVNLGHDLEGKLIRKPVYGRTQDELEEKAVELRKRNRYGFDLTSDNDTFGSYAKKWYKFYKESKEYNTREMYRIMLDKHIIPILGNLKMREIKQSQIQEFFLLISKSDPSKSLVSKIRITLNQVFQKAIENQQIGINPVVGIEIPSTKPEGVKRALTQKEIKVALELARDHKAGLFFVLLLYTGLRKGEAAALTWNDIDFASGWIDINKSIVWTPESPEIKLPKTKASVRKVPLMEPLTSLLAKREKNHKGLYVICNEDGSLLQRSTVRYLWNSFIKDLNIALGGNDNINMLVGITPHSARHTYATILYNAEVDIKTAQTWMGHSKFSVTMDIYTKLDKDKQNKNVNKLQEFISQQE